MVDFLHTSTQLPSLERVYVTFHAGFRAAVDENHEPVVTLPRVQEMSLSRTNPIKELCFPDVLKYLQLPRLTTLCVELLECQVRPEHPIFTENMVNQQLPNFAELPELHVDTGSGEITFRNPSRATLKYRTDESRQYSNRGVIGLGRTSSSYRAEVDCGYRTEPTNS